MLSERRFQIFAKGLFTEIMELWARAEPPARLIPTAIVARRLAEYFYWRFSEALERLWFDSEPLADCLEEILLIATGEEMIINWRPPAIVEMLSQLSEPLARTASAIHATRF
jgi:hypothetical protein